MSIAEAAGNELNPAVQRLQGRGAQGTVATVHPEAAFLNPNARANGSGSNQFMTAVVIQVLLAYT